MARCANKETRELRDAVVAAGAEVVPCRNRTGHFKVYLDGKVIGGFAGTPSYRGRKNDIAKLRRAGLDLRIR